MGMNAKVLIVFGLLTSVLSAPSPQSANDDALTYLMKYHYAGSAMPDPRLGQLVAIDPTTAVAEGLKIFQKKWNLRVTGTLTDETLSLMRKPRCGLPDLNNMEDIPDTENSGARGKRYLLQGSRWSKTSLTYQITRYPDANSISNTRLSRSTIDREIQRALTVWEEVTPLRFTRATSGAPDIDIQFVVREHGDGNPFDGPGNTLAHAYFPQDGNAHFDNEEYFTSRENSGTNLFQVAAHEFGHSLGLSHSEIQSALMAPFYQGYQPNFSLHYDDVMGIQAIYGPNRGPTARSTTTTTVRPPGVATTRRPNYPPICTAANFDAITTHLEGSQKNTYAFRGDIFVQIDNEGIVAGYPKYITQEWPGLPTNLDAALDLPPLYQWVFNYQTYRWNQQVVQPAATYFFKGNNCWRFENKHLSTGYPKLISSEFPGLPNYLDSAFVWSGNDQIYFTKGDQYYRYDRTKRSVDSGYPRPLSAWKGLPSKIDAAFQWINQKTYFFAGSSYYRFEDQSFQVEKDFPRPTAAYWLRCNNLHADMNDQSISSDDAGINAGSHSTQLSMRSTTVLAGAAVALLRILLF